MKLQTTYQPNNAWGFENISNPVQYVRHILDESVTYGTHSDEHKWAMDGDCGHLSKIDRYGYEENPHLTNKNGDCILDVMRENGHKLAPEKDANKSNVYRLENPLRDKGTQFKVGDFEGVKSLIHDALVDLKFDKCELPKLKRELREGITPNIAYSPNSRVSDASQFNWQIRLSKADWAWRSMIIWHELAHLLVPNNSAHDGIFTQTMINLVTKFESKKLGSDLAKAFMTPGKKPGRGKWVSEYHVRDGLKLVTRSKFVEGKNRKFSVDVASPKYGLARFGSQTGFSVGPVWAAPHR